MTELKNAVARVGFALGLLCVALGGGALAIWVVGEGEYSLFDAVYFTVITVASVGYGELPNMQLHPGARTITIVLILFGIGTLATFQSTLTALLVEGFIGKAWRRRNMDKRIAKLHGHYVVVGAGRTGRYVIQELAATDTPFVVIDRDELIIQKLSEDLERDILYVLGDGTEDHTLTHANVQHARGVAAALTDDKDNLFVTLSTRALNPRARIVSKVVDAANEQKILKAGADSTVSPHRIGGERLVSEMLRPRVVEFLDEMMRPTRQKLRFEEVEVPDSPHYVGRSLSELAIRHKTNLLVVALHLPDGEYVYNPAPDHKLVRGVHLIVMGDPEKVLELRKMFASGHAPVA